mmetsp:Transcript_42250/g.122123  ORF Transcript_42250/g.122123 Transcript_42250/m.122123 type:complete len:234 (-) Transcript_42250:1419-2120(-)
MPNLTETPWRRLSSSRGTSGIAPSDPHKPCSNTRACTEGGESPAATPSTPHSRRTPDPSWEAASRRNMLAAIGERCPRQRRLCRHPGRAPGTSHKPVARLSAQRSTTTATKRRHCPTSRPTPATPPRLRKPKSRSRALPSWMVRRPVRDRCGQPPSAVPARRGHRCREQHGARTQMPWRSTPCRPRQARATTPARAHGRTKTPPAADCPATRVCTLVWRRTSAVAAHTARPRL